jgi:predicted small secreted protein
MKFTWSIVGVLSVLAVSWVLAACAATPAGADEEPRPEAVTTPMSLEAPQLTAFALQKGYDLDPTVHAQYAPTVTVVRAIERPPSPWFAGADGRVYPSVESPPVAPECTLYTIVGEYSDSQVLEFPSPVVLWWYADDFTIIQNPGIHGYALDPYGFAATYPQSGLVWSGALYVSAESGPQTQFVACPAV